MNTTIHLDAVLFKALCSLSKGISNSDKRVVDSICKYVTVDPNNNLKLKDFEITYVGEFFERAEERGIKISAIRFATMTLFYGLWKNDFTESDFNDYQIKDFMVLLEKRYESIKSPIMEYAMYLITEDVNYLDNLSNNATIEDFFIILSCTYYFNGNKELSVDVIKKLQYLLETKDMVNGDNYFFFQEILEIAHKLSNLISKNKELKTINAYLKGIDGKLTQKGVVKALGEFGFSPSNIEALNCLLKLKICESPLKRQKQIVSFLIYAKNMEEELDEFEKSIIEKIMALGDFSVKMESGNVTSISRALSYYEILDNVKNTKNFIFLANTAIANNRYNANSLDIGILNSDDFKERICGITSQSNNRFKIHVLAKNVDKVAYRTSNENYDEIKKMLVTIVSRFENAFSMKVIDIWSNVANDWSMNDDVELLYLTLCDFGLLSAIDNLVNDVVKQKFSIYYYKKTKNHDKYTAIKYFYDNNNLNAFKDIFYDVFRNKQTDVCLELKDTTPEEHKVYLEYIGEMAIMSSINNFNNFFFNLLICQVEFVKKIYTNEEIQKLYHTGLSLAETLEEGNNYYSSCYFRKNNVLSDLKNLYMSEEEKEQMRIAKLAEEEEKKQKEIQERNTRVLNKIESISNSYAKYSLSGYGLFSKVYDALDYYDRKTVVYKEFRKNILLNATCYRKEIGDFFTEIGSMIDDEIISLEEGKAIISNLVIIEEKQKEENIA